MKERPILFSAPMVLALLAGRKTQTRRVVKPQPKSEWLGYMMMHSKPGTALLNGPDYPDGPEDELPCPYGAPGDHLLVAAEIPQSPSRDYCAGSDGRIYSRTRYEGFGRKKRVEWHALEGARSSKGYLLISLCHEGKRVTKTVHSLVCSAFYGLPPFSGAQVRHLDGDQENNQPGNLAWGTQEENWLDRRLHGNGVEGEKHPSAIFSDVEREHLRWAVSRGLCSRRHAAKVLGVSPSAIYGVEQANELKEVEQPLPEGRIPRITLEITEVRVQRLQEISDEDAKAEGINPLVSMFGGEAAARVDYRTGFEIIWKDINGGASWQANPWVWAVSFRRV